LIFRVRGPRIFNFSLFQFFFFFLFLNYWGFCSGGSPPFHPTATLKGDICFVCHVLDFHNPHPPSQPPPPQKKNFNQISPKLLSIGGDEGRTIFYKQKRSTRGGSSFLGVCGSSNNNDLVGSTTTKGRYILLTPPWGALLGFSPL